MERSKTNEGFERLHPIVLGAFTAEHRPVATELQAYQKQHAQQCGKAPFKKEEQTILCEFADSLVNLFRENQPHLFRAGDDSLEVRFVAIWAPAWALST